MNERIRELAEQAGFFPELNWDHTGWHAAGHNNTFEKFAELIVRECIEQCLGSLEEDKARAEDKARTDIQRIISGAIVGCTINSANRIKKHFGVEL